MRTMWVLVVGLGLGGGAAAREPWLTTSCAAPEVARYTWSRQHPTGRAGQWEVQSTAGSVVLAPTGVSDAGLTVTVTTTLTETGVPPEVEAAIDAAKARGELTDTPAQILAAGQGAPIQVLNVDVLLAELAVAFDVMMPFFLPPDTPPEMLAMARSRTITPELVAAEFQRYAGSALSYWCRVVDRPSAQFTQTRPNPMGGPPFEVVGKVRFRREGPLVRVALEEEVLLDVLGMLEAMIPPEMAAQVTPEGRAELEALLKSQQFVSVVDTLFDPATGLVVSHHYTTRIVDPALAPPVPETVHLERAAD